MPLTIDPLTILKGETRLQILALIYANETKYAGSKFEDNENYCQDIARKTYKTISTVFQHLTILQEAGILKTEQAKRGNMVVYLFTEEGKEAYKKFLKRQD